MKKQNSIRWMGAFAIAAAMLIYVPAFAQNGVGINATGATADVSAMLDVVSSAKGALLPRMTGAQKTAITTPATGLIIYQTDGTTGYYYNSGTTTTPVWTRFADGNGTAVTSVSASSPLSSTGGQTPNITLSGTVPIANGGTGQTTSQAAIDVLLPTQASNSGKYLTTNGSTSSWATVSGGGGALGQSFVSVYGNGTTWGLTSSNTSYILVPGLTQTVTVPANSTVYLSTDGIGQINCSGTSTYALFNIAFYIDGSLYPVSTAGVRGVFATNTAALAGASASWSMTLTNSSISAATHTFEVRARWISGSASCGSGTGTPSVVVSQGGSAFPSFTVGIIKN